MVVDIDLLLFITFSFVHATKSAQVDWVRTSSICVSKPRFEYDKLVTDFEITHEPRKYVRLLFFKHLTNVSVQNFSGDRGKNSGTETSKKIILLIPFLLFIHSNWFVNQLHCHGDTIYVFI